MAISSIHDKYYAHEHDQQSKAKGNDAQRWRWWMLRRALCHDTYVSMDHQSPYDSELQ